MSLHAYLNFQGNAKEAMEFYAGVLGTEAPSIMYFKDMPPNPDFPIPPECEGWIMHGSIMYNGQLIMFSDLLPNAPLTVGNHLSLLIDLDDVDALKKIYDKFNIKAKITMPFEETFWAQGFGSLIDQFGVEWQFNSSRPNEE